MGTPLRMLVLGVCSDDIEILIAALRRGGYAPTYERVQTVEAMKAALDRQGWDCVVAEYPLPHFDGLSALPVLGEHTSDVPVILFSDTINEHVAVEAMRAGMTDYILKGDTGRLLPVVARELRERDARQQRQSATDAQKETTERLRMAISAAQMYTWDWDIKTGRLIRNGRYEDVYGENAAAGDSDFASFLRAVHPEDRPKIEAVAEQALHEKSSFRVDFRVIRSSDGAVRWLETQARTYYDTTGTASRVIGVTRDISERKEAEDLIHMAYYDTLTNLPNRNGLNNRLRDTIRAASATNQPFALLLMDLNHFKEINDTLGHQRGDLLLKELGRRLKHTLFAPDIVARLGGDEFAMLLPPLAKAADVTVVVTKIQAALQPTFLVDGLPIAVEAGIGVAVYPDHGRDSESLLQKADVAMYAAKRTGRGSVIYDAQYDQHSPARLSLMGELRHAIDQNHLLLHYQPTVDLTSGAVYGVEALVRWQHPLRGMISPDLFIGPAEQTGLIHPLTRWVLETAMHQCTLWNRTGLKLDVSINLSVRNLADPHLPDTVATLLRRGGIDAHQIRFEITESAIMADPVRTQETLGQLHHMGIRFSIDDFGIGYSSLNYLRKLPVDRIKVDKSFVLAMLQNEDDAMIVRSTIELAHNLRLDVVAEGVENQEIYRRLAEWGCGGAQGYFISKPLSAEVLERWLAESPWGRRNVLPKAG